MEKQEYLEVYRHSLAHIMAKAVIEIFGKEHVQYAIGPQIEDGFYYDFELPRAVVPEDFKVIEDRMREIVKRREPWTRKVVTKQEALDIFKNQKFKVELINDLPDEETITTYNTGDDFIDLCRGPHVENSQELMNAAFQVKSVSGSYWRGDEKRDRLQRIYFYCYPDKAALKEHLAFVKEAMERDHKKLGTQLELFMFDETAPGMPYWLPRGWRLYQNLLAYSREIQDVHGYQEISGPVFNNRSLYLTSGHWAHYQTNMFVVPELHRDENGKLVQTEEGKFDMEPVETADIFSAKPMNCQNAMKVFGSQTRSYKDLPIRFSEMDVLHRKEKSGQMNGLLRVQEFRQDDDHTFVMESQIEDEVNDIFSIADEIYNTFGVTYRAELSTRPEDFMGDINVWNDAEAALKRILDKKYGEGGYEINEGDGAFYGPKIDLMIKDALGREWQCGTFQLDFQLPLNFGLKYTAQDGTQKTPVVIHRAIYGSLERFIGVIIENFKGAFPFWLSPYQVGIVPIRTEHNDYAKEVMKKLAAARVRCEADYSDNNMKEKIKKYKNLKDPFIIVLGDKEAAERTVSINVRGSNKQIQNVPLDDFVSLCTRLNIEKTLELPDSV
ncbi:MAG: threonine--tRNA ligase [Lachnospiraceae bacterium]|nr:threonine--tRNA ligase [Lachnospiraceae bacterium]